MTDTLQKLFEDTFKDLYNAEKQFLKAMPKLAKATENESLKKVLENHRTQTEEHIKRLEQAAEKLEIKPTGKVCKAAQGLVEEANEHLEEVAPGPVLDAAIITCAQKNEHYEICSYGTLIAWANQLGLNEIVPILEKTLAEEEDADADLTEVAEGMVNAEAKAEKPEKKESPAKKASVK